MKNPKQNKKQNQAKIQNKISPAKRKKAKPTRRRKTPPPTDKIVAPTGPDIPHWIPDDYHWEKFPESIRQTVPRLLAPAYRRFVLDAPGELERSVGLTLVHLMWLELCGQIQMAIATANPDSLDALLGDPEGMLERHLRLTTAKCQTAELLMKLRIVENALQRSPGGEPAALPPPDTALAAIPQSAPLPQFPECS